MIRKTVREFKRLARTHDNKYLKETHAELVRRETWWLLFVIPVFSRDEIVRTNI